MEKDYIIQLIHLKLRAEKEFITLEVQLKTITLFFVILAIELLEQMKMVVLN
jgi:hypothetical protein